MASPVVKLPLPRAPAGAAPHRVPEPFPPSDLARLATLHREAEETAHLANLLGRAPLAAGLLAVGTGIVAALAAVAGDGLAISAWAVLMLVAIAAATRSYTIAIRQPFERAPLKAFADDLTAILTYAGFAWGAGVFLALPADTGPLAATAFAVLPVAGIAALLRAGTPVLSFAAPLALLSALGMAVRLADGALPGLLTLALTGAVAGILLWREGSSSLRLPRLAGLPFA
jgi:hypothetical protein